MEGVTPRDPRRWLILFVLSLSTMLLVVDNTALTVAVPDMARDLHAGRGADPMGAGLVPAGLRRAAAHHRWSRRPLRAASDPDHGAAALRCGVVGGRIRGEPGAVDRGAGGHGDRCGRHPAELARHSDHRLRYRRAPSGHGDLGRRLGARTDLRAGARRGAHLPIRLGCGLFRQCADRRGGHHRGVGADTGVTRSAARFRSGRRGAVGARHDGDRRHHYRMAAAGIRRSHRRATAVGRPRLGRIHRLGAACRCAHAAARTVPRAGFQRRGPGTDPGAIRHRRLCC